MLNIYSRHVGNRFRQSTRGSQSSLQRIDFIGATLITLPILAFLVPLELGGVTLPWNHPFIISLLVVGSALLFLFLEMEKRALESIFAFTNLP